MNLPKILTEGKAWCVWKYVIRNNKKTKMPFHPSGAIWKSNDPSTWASYEEVTQATGYEGIGRRITGDLVGVDVDWKEASEPPKILPELIAALASWTEWSPSGRGIHVWVRGQWTAGWAKRAVPPEGCGVEVYDKDSPRFFTVTGKPVENTPSDIRENNEGLKKLIALVGGKAKVAVDPLLKGRPQGERREGLFSEGARLRRLGLSPEETRAALTVYARNSTPQCYQIDIDECIEWLWKKEGSKTDPSQEPELKLEDFYAYMPMHNYLHIPSNGTPWPAPSVNARLKSVPSGKRDTQGSIVYTKAAAWLDEHRPVEQMTWWPGKPQIIANKVFCSGALIEQYGNKIYNFYRAPKIEEGDPDGAKFWLDVIDMLYPDCAEHIVKWFAHRVQRPDEKVNHALVLGGGFGIGKDSVLDPVRHAIGEWNFTEVSPVQIMGRFNQFLRSVLLRISEVRDMGDINRFDFYEHMKAFLASPPEVLRCDEKHLREYEIPNLVGVVMTTNHRTNGIFLPRGDRRHYVAWSWRDPDKLGKEFWDNFYDKLKNGGRRDIAVYLRNYDLSTFNPKEPPPKTEHFKAIVDANTSPEDDEMTTFIDELGNPEALIVSDLLGHNGIPETFKAWLSDRKNARSVPHRLEQAGYVSIHNDSSKAGRWKVAGRDCMVYAKVGLDPRDRYVAAKKLVECRKIQACFSKDM